MQFPVKPYDGAVTGLRVMVLLNLDSDGVVRAARHAHGEDHGDVLALLIPVRIVDAPLKINQLSRDLQLTPPARPWRLMIGRVRGQVGGVIESSNPSERGPAECAAPAAPNVPCAGLGDKGNPAAEALRARCRTAAASR